MGAIIYGLFFLLGLAYKIVIFGMVLAPAYFAFKWGAKMRDPRLRTALPMLVVGLPVIWLGASYVVFRAGCEDVPGAVFYGETPSPKPQAIVVDRRIIKRKSVTETKESFPDYSASTEFLLTESAPIRAAHWWFAPIYRHEIQVTERFTGRLMASATDMVFGGGILSRPMAILGGDQDYSHLSCGYASSRIDAWRPTLSDSPRFVEYARRDFAILARATDPSNSSAPP